MITIHLIDEINVQIETDEPNLIEELQDRTKIFNPKRLMLAAVKLGYEDAYESAVADDGFCFLHMMDDILDILDKLGFKENEIEINDQRIAHVPAMEPVDIHVFEEHGWTLREEQKDSINTVIEHEQGIVELGTAGGKSLIMAGTCKLYDPHMPSITVTDNSDLVDQLADTYKSLGLEVVNLKKVKTDKRAEVFDKHCHVIMTNKLLTNCMEVIPDDYQGVFLYDEVHIFGEKAAAVIQQRLGDCPIRVGFTGTLTDSSVDPVKRLSILNHIGGGVLIDIGVRELREAGHVSEFDVEVIEIDDQIGRKKQDKLIQHDLWDWENESRHLSTCAKRAEVIADFVTTQLNGANTLILCRPQFGKLLSKALNAPFIDKDTKNRKQYYDQFEEVDDMLLVATYGTVGTGISIDRIFNEVLVDVGKNHTYIGQGIGRGIRKDGDIDYVKIYDLYSSTLYSRKQKAKRLTYYRKKGYPFEEKDYGLICS